MSEIDGGNGKREPIDAEVVSGVFPSPRAKHSPSGIPWVPIVLLLPLVVAVVVCLFPAGRALVISLICEWFHDLAEYYWKIWSRFFS